MQAAKQHQTLTDVDDSVLVVIDVQQSFLAKMSKEHTQPIINRISWLVQRAVELNVPIVATAEDIPSQGKNIPQISDFFPEGTIEYNKMSFGLAGDPVILTAIESTHRKSAIIVGLETDVCVMQSALGLLQKGFRVVVLSDATASPGPCHKAGILRMQNAGAIISTVKGTFYEWIRKVDFAGANFDAEIWDSEQPEGIYL
jgi:nicotinamidase-related amidase